MTNDAVPTKASVVAAPCTGVLLLGYRPGSGPRDFAGCENGQVRSWTYAPGESDYSHEPGELAQLWILDVDGVRLVLEASSLPWASAQDQAELLQMVESIRIDPR